MRFVKWSILFVVAFLVAWSIIFTFLQEPFLVPVQAKLLKWTTPPMPIVGYLAGAFALGLGIGLSIAVYNYIALSFRLRKANNAYKELSSYTDTLKIKLGAQSDKMQRSQSTDFSPSAPISVPDVQPNASESDRDL